MRARRRWRPTSVSSGRSPAGSRAFRRRPRSAMAARTAAARRRDEPPRTAERVLAEAIGSRRARVGVVGLGYVGLPLACTFAEGGFPVAGFDADAEKIRVLRAGGTYIRHVPASRLAALHAPVERVLAPDPARGRLAATTDRKS